MKKKIIWIILLITILGGSGYYYFKNIYIPKLTIEDEKININNLYIYGTHLNLEGKVNNKDNLKLVLYNGDFKEINTNYEDDNFNLSRYINDGLYLDNIPRGKYYMFMRSGNEDDYKYYALNNTTEYPNTTYYTSSKINNKIVIQNEESYPTMIMNVEKNKDDNIYDVVIDPGHGGMDSGALNNKYRESSFTMDIALGIKKKLENSGLKVKLTREKDQLGKDELLEEYGPSGRAVIPHNVHAKYLFSIHINSNPYRQANGLEIYTAKNINYDFAKTLTKNIIRSTGLNYSTNRNYKIFNGIYSRNFSNNDIIESRKEKKNKNLQPYDISKDSNYFYIIRETGGIVTGAFVDDRNKKILGNPYVKTNVGIESYLLELGFISNNSDLKKLINNPNSYIDSISNSIIDLYNNK